MKPDQKNRWLFFKGWIERWSISTGRVLTPTFRTPWLKTSRTTDPWRWKCLSNTPFCHPHFLQYAVSFVTHPGRRSPFQRAPPGFGSISTTSRVYILSPTFGVYLFFLFFELNRCSGAQVHRAKSIQPASADRCCYSSSFSAGQELNWSLFNPRIAVHHHL